MALTVEDGTIVPGAQSYVSAADATTYHAARLNTAWTGTDAVKEAALRKAAAYLDGKHRRRWKGQRTSPTVQEMEWPRSGVRIVDAFTGDWPPSGFDSEYYGFLASDTIPQRLKDAQCELALRALAADLAPDFDGAVKSQTVDVISTEYFPGAGPGSKTYQIVDHLLSDLLNPLGSCDALRG